jgi:EmrB/QacA subfamily drug resistance transporter
LVLLSVAFAQFSAPLMVTSVGVALPTLGRDLGATAVQLGLIEQLYVVSMAMGMLTFGRYGDIVGQRKVFLPGVAIFTIMSCSLGLAQSVGMIMVQRLIQGFGVCMMLSGSMALVVESFPVEVRGRMIGVVSAFTYAGLSLGPVLGGFITTHFGWRYVFLMSAPLGAGSLAFGLTGLRKGPRTKTQERMDWKGGAYYAVSLALIMLGSSHAKEWFGMGMLACGVVLGLIFLRVQSRTEFPLLDVNALKRNRFFTFSSLAALGNYAATFGVTFLMSLFLQYGKGMSPRAAGTLLVLQPLTQILVSPIAGRLADKFRLDRLASLGMMISFVGLISAALTIAPDTPTVLLACELVVIGLGFGLFIAPNSTAIMSSAPRGQFGMASGMIGAMRTLGMAVSMTTITLIISFMMGEEAVTAQNLPVFLTSMRVALTVSAVFSCLGVVLSLKRGSGKGS